MKGDIKNLGNTGRTMPGGKAATRATGMSGMNRNLNPPMKAAATKAAQPRPRPPSRPIRDK